MPWSLAEIPNLTGRVAVVTGANGGLGLETTRELAHRGCRVVMGVRNASKAEAAVDAIHAAAPLATLDVRALDLASLTSIRDFAQDVAADYPAIDILVNNAGVMGIPRAETADGFEMQFGVNHLGHFALTARLFPALLRAPAARVVNVSSSGRFFAPRFDPEDVHMRRGYDPWQAYGRSKVANADFAVELDRRAREAGIALTAYTADPGFAATDLQAHSFRTHGGRSQRFFYVYVNRYGSTPLQGALPQLRAATDPNAVRGSMYGLRFVARGAPVRIPMRHGRKAWERRRLLWEVSERETAVAFPVAAPG